MKIDASYQVSRVLPPPGDIFQRFQRRTERMAQGQIAPAILRVLMTGEGGGQCCTVDLGEEILVGGPSASVTGDLFLVAAGAVRLMAENTPLQRTVSVARLGPGQGFGLDGQASLLWTNRTLWPQSLPYWAKAAAPSQVVRIPAGAVAAVFDRWPILHRQFQHQFQQRSSLAFFKQLTLLGAVPSTLLMAHLLPNLMEYSLRAGASLTQLPLVATDCLWLCQGQLFNPRHPDQVIVPGDCWGYPATAANAMSMNWVAKTDSLLYRLPLYPTAVVG